MQIVLKQDHGVTALNRPRDKYESLVEELFSEAGVKVNGEKPYDIQVKDKRFYKRMIRDGTVGLGESYMDGWWDCEDMVEFNSKVISANLQEKFDKNLKFIFYFLKAKLIPDGSENKAFVVGKHHYDWGNEFFEMILDPLMIYSCGYWQGVDSLEEAQLAKLELVCKKMGLKPGMRVLDIGCGWGGFARYAAEKYGVSVTGVSVSKEQIKWGMERRGNLPIDFKLMDYREIKGKYDRIVSIGMFEHVCPPFYRKFFETAQNALEDDGMLLLHTMGRNKSVKKPDGPWVRKYIFPNSEIPSLKQITEAAEGLFILEDWQNFGTYYDKTCRVWHERLKAHKSEIVDLFDERFYKMQEYSLLFFAGLFRCRFLNVWQFVFSKRGLKEGYQKFFKYDFFQR